MAQDEFLDEAIEMVLKFGGFVGTIDNPAIIFWVCIGLSAKFESEILDEPPRRACERLGDAGKIRNDRFDTIALSLNLWRVSRLVRNGEGLRLPC